MRCMCWDMPTRIQSSLIAGTVSASQVVAKDRFFVSERHPALIPPLSAQEGEKGPEMPDISCLGGFTGVQAQDTVVGIPDRLGPTSSGTAGPQWPVVSGEFGTSP